jgi:uncharacterized protein (TIGR03083 family)
MTITITCVNDVPAITRREASTLAATENTRAVRIMQSLQVDDWTKPTDCPAWDVRAMAAHVLGGMEAFASFPEFVHQMRAGKKNAGDGAFIDGMTAVQVREREALTTEQLVQRLAQVAPRAARGRGRVPGLLRRMPMKQEAAGTVETWRMGYLLDVILTRDTWMHRVDIARATGRELILTADHDARIVADVVAEWARRHDRPFVLHLEGPAGGTFSQGGDGEDITLDAVEFCRTLSGRATGVGLLNQEVPF